MIRLLAAVVALVGWAALPAHAQSESAGRIEGTVTDSVHAGRPLPGVRVVAVGTGERADARGEATSDSAGHYRIESLAAGRYMVGFESPLLDSLEIALPPREAMLPPLSTVSVDLAMPPAAKLRRAVCRDTTLAEGTGVVYGHVVDAETENPLAGAEIALQWRDLAFDRKNLRTLKSERTASAKVDDGGWYRVCGVATGAWVLMQVQVAGRVGPVLRTRVDDTLGIAIRHLSFPALAASDSSDSATAAVIAPFVGTATLTGIVRGAGGLPVAAAEVRVRGARSSGVTDEQGRYTLSALPAGTRELEVRRIGYALTEASVELRSGTTRRRDVQLERIVTLDSMVVVATRSRYPEFSLHRKFGVFGKFLGPEELGRRHFPRTSDYVRTVGGFLIDNSRGRTRVVSARGGGTRSCSANVVIDGFDMGRMDRDALSVDDVHPRDVGAIEIYREGDITPAEYVSGCGLIVIWTKR